MAALALAGTAASAFALGPAEVQRPVGGLPAPGTTWKYSFRDRQFGGPPQSYSVTAVRVEGSEVKELLAVEHGDIKESMQQAGKFAFTLRPLNGGYSVLELATYAGDALKEASDAAPTGYPPVLGRNWEVIKVQRGAEQVSVPAGTFPSLRVEVTGRIAFPGGTNNSIAMLATRFVYTCWYSAKLGRCVKIRHQTWSQVGQQIGDELSQLVEFRPASPPAAGSTPGDRDSSARPGR